MERAELARTLGFAWRGDQAGPHWVEAEDPRRFMADFGAAVAAGGNVFLCDPAWKASERELARALSEAASPEGGGWLMVPSGGSGGRVKFARHDGTTIQAAVDGFRRHFRMERVHAVSVLPLHHVSGLMAWMRCALTGGSLLPWSWKEAQAGRFPDGAPSGSCLSLVPTQLQRLLSRPESVDWLRSFAVIFVGGGPSWESLLGEAERLGLPLSLGYGATETAAMVAALTPEQFLKGERGCGRALPHARIELVDGLVRIRAESLYLGYHPNTRNDPWWDTGDMGSLDASGNLTILGRSDDVLITGGKKVSPAEVESALRASGQFEDVVVVGLQDPEWGQMVVACHPRGTSAPLRERVESSLEGLAPYKHPKRYVELSPWPRNAQGKVSRSELARLAAAR